MVPTFLVLGGQRCGTTWLHKMLAAHPDVFVVEGKEVLEGKELDYFYRVGLTQPFSEYEKNFANTQEYLAKGDMSVNYCMLKTPVIQEIRRILPHLKIVLTLRNPVERSWSQLKLIYDLIDIRAKSLSDLSPQQMVLILGQCRVTRRSDFLGIIKRWQQVFGADAFHIPLYEDLKSNPHEYLSNVLTHIEVDPLRLPQDAKIQQKVHVGGSEDMPDLVRWWLCKQWLEPVKELNQHLDGKVEHWVADIERDLKTLSPPTGWNPLTHTIKALPERIAYAIYDRRRERKLVSRLKSVPTKLP